MQRWSSGAEEPVGHATANAVGRKVDFIVPVHLRDAHWAGFHRAMSNPVIKDLAADLPVLCADGDVRPFAGRLLVLSDGLGTALGALAVYANEGTTGVHPFDHCFTLADRWPGSRSPSGDAYVGAIGFDIIRVCRTC